jgi:hypothetical protein
LIKHDNNQYVVDDEIDYQKSVINDFLARAVVWLAWRSCNTVTQQSSTNSADTMSFQSLTADAFTDADTSLNPSTVELLNSPNLLELRKKEQRKTTAATQRPKKTGFLEMEQAATLFTNAAFKKVFLRVC